VVAREGGRPRLWKSHGESFSGETNRFTNHRYGLYLDHDSPTRTFRPAAGARVAQSIPPPGSRWLRPPAKHFRSAVPKGPPFAVPFPRALPLRLPNSQFRGRPTEHPFAAPFPRAMPSRCHNARSINTPFAASFPRALRASVSTKFPVPKLLPPALLRGPSLHRFPLQQPPPTDALAPRVRELPGGAGASCWMLCQGPCFPYED
jgi:hypothetical protein